MPFSVKPSTFLSVSILNVAIFGWGSVPQLSLEKRTTLYELLLYEADATIVPCTGKKSITIPKNPENACFIE